MAKETGILEQDLANYAINHASNGLLGSGLSVQNFMRLAKKTGVTDALNNLGKNKDKDTQRVEADAMNNIVGNKY